jgi:hypothetical protein
MQALDAAGGDVNEATARLIESEFLREVQADGGERIGVACTCARRRLETWPPCCFPGCGAVDVPTSHPGGSASGRSLGWTGALCAGRRREEKGAPPSPAAAIPLHSPSSHPSPSQTPSPSSPRRRASRWR